MSNKGDIWASSGFKDTSNIANRSYDIGRTIDDNPSYVSFIRSVPPNSNITLPAQRMRIDFSTTGSESQDTTQNMKTVINQLIIVGYRNHPIIPDTNIQRSDRFTFGDNLYEIISLSTAIPGRIIAEAKLYNR